MKLSVSLPDEDIAVLDEHVQKAGVASRSAAIHQAIQLLRHADLEEDYAAAWEDWEESGDRETWEVTTADGVG